MAIDSDIIRILCSSKTLIPPTKTPSLRWLISSPLFLPPLTVISSIPRIHADTADESDEIRTLLIRGFDIVGALFVGDGNIKENASKAVAASFEMRRAVFGEGGGCRMIGAATNLSTGGVGFFVYDVDGSKGVESVVVYEDSRVWEIGCLLRCELAIKLPVYFPGNNAGDIEERFSSLSDAVAAKFRDPQVSYLVEGQNVSGAIQPVVLHGAELDFGSVVSDQMSPHTRASLPREGSPLCSHFCSENKWSSSLRAKESAETIRVSLLSNQSRSKPNSAAPVAEYFPASESARSIVVSFNLDVLCYASKDFPVAAAISKLVVPGLVDQLSAMKRTMAPMLLKQHPQLCVCHFLPPGILHPVSIIYDLRYGETESAQVELRKSLHLRLGLPLDRPLLRIANALTFHAKDSKGSNSIRKESPLLRDVHTEILSSGVSGGIVSIIDGSYEYYHYLLNGFDDNGWGCAYRSLQTIISWFRLQHYTPTEVPSHREIQQALVEIGDKELSFVGSREWIGAIELSFVLDKLLGVSCKIMNVRSGSELPEKCRELALHFETQGTPVMIGGGVLAYTLLGVDYNEVSGDCAFLILDPHYTGNDDLKKIVSGGWCGWKKAVDSRGRNFFLHDKFYNLLLPQRPDMV